MYSDNNKVNHHTNNNQGNTRENPDTYKFYNLLFSGKINIKEYLGALQSMRNDNKKNN